MVPGRFARSLRVLFRVASPAVGIRRPGTASLVFDISFFLGVDATEPVRPGPGSGGWRGPAAGLSGGVGELGVQGFRFFDAGSLGFLSQVTYVKRKEEWRALKVYKVYRWCQKILEQAGQ